MEKISFRPTPKEMVIARSVAVKAAAEVVSRQENLTTTYDVAIINVAKPIAKWILSGEI